MSTFGIDLGTTNSVISHIVAGRAQAIDIDGSPIVPSIVLYREGGIIVGREARNLALLHPEHTVVSVKRSMGRTGPVAVAGQALTPEAVSAEILRKLAHGALATTGLTVRDIVLTVPAYFDEGQRRATLDAAELAGLHVLRLINEPTAASLVYDSVAGLEDEPHTVLVYDLGGGTFDVSVLDVMGDVREVKATTGDTHLGGDDFDRLLVNRFREELQARHGVDSRGDAVASARLQRLAEETKIALSTEVVVPVRAEFLTGPQGQPVHLELEIRRSEFEDLVRPHLQRTIDMARQAVQAAGLQADDVGRICLVGGSTRIPLVRQMLAEAFDADVHEEIDADLAVSLGAAMQAAVLQGEPIERILVDVTAHDLGVRVVDDDHRYGETQAFAAVIHRNTVLPTRRVREFYTAYDNQPAVHVEVFQGNSPNCSENREVGRFEFELAPAPEGSPVRCEFEYDLSGMVRVSVAQIGHDKAKTVALRIADAAAPQDEAVEHDHIAVPTTAVQRKAEILREQLDGQKREQLDLLLAAYLSAQGELRVEAEEALLDFFVDHDDRE